MLVFGVMSWQLGASLLDFDVQTSNDGSTWTTRATVTKTAASFAFGTNSTKRSRQYASKAWISSGVIGEAFCHTTSWPEYAKVCSV